MEGEWETTLELIRGPTRGTELSSLPQCTKHHREGAVVDVHRGTLIQKALGLVAVAGNQNLGDQEAEAQLSGEI